jgi:hypothetical protein
MMYLAKAKVAMASLVQEYSTISAILGDVLSPRDTRNGLKERDASSGSPIQ